MQKFAKILDIFAIFLPAVVILYLCESWIFIAVGAMNPAAALDWLKYSSKNTPVMQSAASPFENFTLNTQQNITTRTKSENYHKDFNVVEEFFASSESDIILRKENCYVKNLTHHSRQEVKNIMLADVGFSVEKHSSQPQILIYHTHATESYTPTRDSRYPPGYSWRSTDKGQNMVQVGRVMADTLNSLGYNTIQDATLHDYPSYNGSYDLSKNTVEKYLEKYPSIKIVLDVHRDAVERDGRLINPVVNINGEKHAQIMIISGCDNGYMNMPNYVENLKFATNLQNQLAKDRPGLARPVLFDYRNYNQQLSTGALLVEIGTHGSTLQQAENSRRAFAQSLGNMLDKMQ